MEAIPESPKTVETFEEIAKKEFFYGCPEFGRLEANGQTVQWQIDGVGADGKFFMSEVKTQEELDARVKARRTIGISAVELKAEVEIGNLAREIAGKDGRVYDAAVNTLTKPADGSEPTKKDLELKEYLQQNKGQILEYMAVCMRAEGLNIKQAYEKAVKEAVRIVKKSGVQKPLETFKNFFEIDFEIVAQAMNNVVADFYGHRAHEFLANEQATTQEERPVRSKPQTNTLHSLMLLTAGDKKDEGTAVYNRSNEETAEILREGIGEPAITEVLHGEVEVTKNAEATIPELESRLKLDREIAIKLLESGKTSTWTIQKIRGLEQRILEDFNELRLARFQQTIIDWKDLPEDWVTFLGAIQEAKMTAGVIEEPIMPKETPTTRRIKKEQAQRQAEADRLSRPVFEHPYKQNDELPRNIGPDNNDKELSVSLPGVTNAEVPIPVPIESLAPASPKIEAQKMRPEAPKVKEKPEKRAESKPAVVISDDEGISSAGGRISETAMKKAVATPTKPGLLKGAWESVKSLFSSAQKAVAETEKESIG